MNHHRMIVACFVAAGCLDTTAPPEDGGLGWPGPDAPGDEAAEGGGADGAAVEGEAEGGVDGPPAQGGGVGEGAGDPVDPEGAGEAVDPGEGDGAAEGDEGVEGEEGADGGEAADEGGDDGGADQGGDDGPIVPPTMGDPDGPCYPNGTCNGDNFCDLVTETCQPAPVGADDGSGQGGDEGVGGEEGGDAPGEAAEGGDGDDGGDAGEGGEVVEPDPCIRVQRLHAPWNVRPAGLRVTARVLDCDGRPVRRLNAQEIVVIDDETGAPFESVSQPLRPGRAYVVLALDLSDGSPVDEVVDEAVAYAEAATAVGHRVAVLAYGRPDAQEWIASYSGDPAALRRRLDRLRGQQTRGTRDLYGAYMAALEAAHGQGIALEERFVVLHARGGHSAGDAEARRALALEARRTSTATVLVRTPDGDEGADQAIELASEGIADAAAFGALVSAAGAVDRLLAATYLIGVCTPAALGEPILTVRATLGEASDSRAASYCLHGLNGDLGGCDPADVAAGLLLCEPSDCAAGVCDVACQDRVCGDDRGISCGRCGAGEVCDGGLACVAGCLDMECGVDRGMICGGCAARQRCEEHLCTCDIGWEGADCEIRTITPFDVEAHAASQVGVQWLVSQENNGSVGGAATGLALLALLELRDGPGRAAQARGYVGLEPAEQQAAQRMARYIINSLPGFIQGNPQSYQTGAGLMGLSVFLATGGPNEIEARVTVREAVQTAVEALKRTQGNVGTNLGGWNYTTPGAAGDLSTTQFAAAGLSAADRIVAGASESLPLMSEFLANAQNPDLGHTYQSGGNREASHAMTAAGGWSWRMAQVQTTDPRFQGALRWLSERYQVDGQTNWWNNSYYYYLWAASKTFLTSERPLVAPEPEDPDAPPLVWGDEMGGLRDPAEDGFPHTPTGWYYDMAWQLVSEQGDNGAWPVRRANGSNGQNAQADTAFAVLVLNRSLGGACLPDVAPCDPPPQPDPVPDPAPAPGGP